jgi:hypothetical protein
MEEEREPVVIVSDLCSRVTGGGVSVDIQIYRLEHETAWTLEVVDHEGASTVFDDKFETDQAALDAAMKVIEDEGISTFVEDRSGTLHYRLTTGGQEPPGKFSNVADAQILVWPPVLRRSA